MTPTARSLPAPFAVFALAGLFLVGCPPEKKPAANGCATPAITQCADNYLSCNESIAPGGTFYRQDKASGAVSRCTCADANADGEVDCQVGPSEAVTRCPGNAPAATFAAAPTCESDNPLGKVPDDTASVVAVLAGQAGGGVLPCTGTVIERRAVLTAAHCVENAAWLEVYKGGTFPQPFNAGTGIEAQVLADPEYDAAPRSAANPTNEFTDGHDLAIVITSEDLGVPPIRINTSPVTAASLSAYSLRMVGYGHTMGRTGVGTRRTRAVRAANVNANHVELDPVLCSGDSGGPVFARAATGAEFLVGVNAFSDGVVDHGCGEAFAAYATRVDASLSFIRWALHNLAARGLITGPFVNHVPAPYTDAIAGSGAMATVDVAIGELQGLRDLGIQGFADGSFRPAQPITRAEFAAMIAASLTRDLQPAPTTFGDVPSTHWAHVAIGKAVRGGFLTGDPSGSFRPDATITRQEVLVALANGLALPTGSLARVRAQWTDAASIAPWAQVAVAAALDAQVLHNTLLLKSTGGTELLPAEPATRRDAASLLWNAYQRRGATPYECRFRHDGC